MVIINLEFKINYYDLQSNYLRQANVETTCL